MKGRLMRAVTALVDEYDMCPAGGTVLCAVSGGADSMCLLHLLLSLGERRGFSVVAAHFNHHLRGEASDGDQRFVEDWCRERGVPCFTGEGDVAAEASRTGRGTEDAARTLRYAFLERAAEQEGACRIATAHQADDNLETLLLRLARGTGLAGMSGIPPRRGNIVRPLLEVGRADILAYLAEYGIPHREDESNRDLSTPRNLVRHQVVPALRQLNPSLVAAAVRAQRGLRQDEAYLNAQAAKAVAMAQVSEEGVTVFASALSNLPEAVAVRAARRLWGMTDRKDCSTAHLRAILALARGDSPSARADLPGGWEARRVYDRLMLCRRGEKTAPPPAPAVLDLSGETCWAGQWLLRCAMGTAPEEQTKNPALFPLACDTIKGTLAVRARRPGDRLKLAGREGTKTVKKWMVECKVPRALRDALPVLEDESGIVAVFGVGVAERCAAAPGSHALLVQLNNCG